MTILKPGPGSRPALIGSMISAMLMLTPPAAFAQSEQSDQGLVGTWRVVITPYICGTSTTLPALALSGLVTYHRGGTATGTNNSVHFAPGQRTSEFGVWSYVGGGTFQSLREAFILFSTDAGPQVPALVRGTQRIEESIQVTNDDLFALARTQQIAASGGVVASLCGQIVGQRMR